MAADNQPLQDTSSNTWPRLQWRLDQMHCENILYELENLESYLGILANVQTWGNAATSESLKQHRAYSLNPFSLAFFTSPQYLSAEASLILLPHLTIPNRLAFHTKPITATVTYVFRYPVASSQGVIA